MKTKIIEDRPCKHCGTVYSPTAPSDSFCSLECKFDFFVERDKLFENPTPDGCIEWKGQLDKYGYGRIRYRKSKFPVHRIIAVKKYGGIPKKNCVMHSCDNRKCINPDHISIGTVAENNTDRAQKGRNGDISGEKCYSAKLTEAQVRYIRATYTKSSAKVAKEFGISPTTLYNVINRDTWKHI